MEPDRWFCALCGRARGREDADSATQHRGGDTETVSHDGGREQQRPQGEPHVEPDMGGGGAAGRRRGSSMVRATDRSIPSNVCATKGPPRTVESSRHCGAPGRNPQTQQRRTRRPRFSQLTVGEADRKRHRRRGPDGRVSKPDLMDTNTTSPARVFKEHTSFPGRMESVQGWRAPAREQVPTSFKESVAHERNSLNKTQLLEDSEKERL